MFTRNVSVNRMLNTVQSRKASDLQFIYCRNYKKNNCLEGNSTNHQISTKFLREYNNIGFKQCTNLSYLINCIRHFSVTSTCLSNKDDSNKPKELDDKKPAENKKDVATQSSPLEIKTKSGKLIVTAPDIEATLKSNVISTSAVDEKHVKKIELEVKKGKLFVITTTDEDGKLGDNIVFERKVMPENQPNRMETVVLSKPSDALKEKPSAKLAEDNIKSKRPERVDFTRSSLERNFITPGRAMSDFLLKMSDLESLPKTKRRSPYEQEPPIVVYWRKDVETKAISVWGSRENLLRECLKREIERKRHQQNIFTVKRRLRDYRREMGSRTDTEYEPGLKGGSGKIADPDHPYGYANMKYVSSLISGVGIFCVGTGLSFYHGIMGIMHPVPTEDFFWAFCILGGSLISEGATLLVAVNSIRQSAKKDKISFREYVVRGQDPCVNVVLFEDTAAVASVALAAGCMALSTVTGSPVFDAVGSLLVGCMLGGVASFIIYANVQALVGRSIAAEQLDKINAELESDVMIRAIHDVKGIDMGNSLVRYKAEMDFDGRELTRFYLDKQDLNKLLEEVRSFNTVEELETYLLKHGENIVDLMGGEIDRIEMKLRKKFPEVRHCDLEIL